MKQSTVAGSGLSRQACRRCGTCCRNGGPAFHGDDRALIEQGTIDAKYLYTIRPGEPVRDNVKGTIEPSPTEILKIKGRGNTWTCCFFNEAENRCRIYDHRPLECRALKCWDTRDIEAIYAQDRLTRKDVLSGVASLWDLIEDHGQRCDYHRLGCWVDALTGPDRAAAVNGILDMIKYDKHLRLLVVEKAGVDPALNDFLFGRALVDTVKRFGLAVRREGGKIIVRRRV